VPPAEHARLGVSSSLLAYGEYQRGIPSMAGGAGNLLSFGLVACRIM
jgi:hypothetical protein